jgi:hypothetical protein
MTVWLLLIMYTSNGQQLAYANVFAGAAACERKGAVVTPRPAPTAKRAEAEAWEEHQRREHEAMIEAGDGPDGGDRGALPAARRRLLPGERGALGEHRRRRRVDDLLGVRRGHRRLR